MATQEYQLVLTTCPDKSTAEQIAQTLVAEKLAACVNIVAGVSSVYMWQDQVTTDQELQLLIKTSSDKFTGLASRIEQLHPYQVPEIIALNIQQGNKAYLNWISSTLQ